MASIAGYIYYQDKKIQDQQIQLENSKKEREVLAKNIDEQKLYFEDKIEKEKFTIKYIEKKATIEKKVKKDEKDTAQSTPNRFYL